MGNAIRILEVSILQSESHWKWSNGQRHKRAHDYHQVIPVVSAVKSSITLGHFRSKLWSNFQQYGETIVLLILSASTQISEQNSLSQINSLNVAESKWTNNRIAFPGDFVPFVSEKVLFLYTSVSIAHVMTLILWWRGIGGRETSPFYR